MRRRRILCWCGQAAAFSAVTAGGGLPGFADETAFSAADEAFVMKVSQGGMFEVAAGALAAQKAGEQDVADIGNTEQHDHSLVGARLKDISGRLGISFALTLNAEFQGRLDGLSRLDGRAFDDQFITEMQRIHAADGAAFAVEARSGKNPLLRRFASETLRIVRRHIGALDALPLPTA